MNLTPDEIAIIIDALCDKGEFSNDPAMVERCEAIAAKLMPLQGDARNVERLAYGRPY